jgi:hypothetical protein
MMKLKFQLLTSAILIIVGCGLLIAGFCVPPVGIIDSSILIAFGEILTFVGAIFGIDYTYRFRVNNNKGERRNDDTNRS